MKVPKEIRGYIKECQELNIKANKLDIKIRDWFIENNINNDGTLDCYIDTVEQGQGSVNVLVKHIEDNFEALQVEGNNSDY